MTSQQKSQNKKLSALMRTSALTAVGLVAVVFPSLAEDYTLPVNGQVVGGSSTITNPSTGLLNINQHTDRTVINWDSFNVGRDGTVQFFQPGTGSLAVNRVTGAGNDPTKILGTLRANGNVMVLDRNGVLFGKDSVVDVGGLIASSGNVDTAAIMNGGRFLELSGLGAGGDVVNEGSITVSDSGLAAFVAPVVENNGVINARLGRVSLAAGVDKATVDLYGDGLVELTVGDGAAKVLAKNSGVINAAGGQVQMTAAAAKSVVDQAVNMSGVINASHATVKGGKIILSGGNAKVNVSGKIKADGATGGGDVSVKGNEVKIESSASIDANATVSGNGGTVYIIGDRTYYYGAMAARGAGAGSGGNAEVSGRTVDMTGTVDLKSASGKFGTLLIDPSGMIVQSDDSIANGSVVMGDYNVSYFNDLYIASLLATGNVVMIGNDFIDIGTRRAGYNFVTGNPADDVAANAIFNSLGDGNIDFGVYDGTTTIGTLFLNGAEVNFNRDTTIGLGNFDVDASTINLDGKLYGTLADTTTHPLLNATRLSSNSGLVNVLSDNALIQQGLDFVVAGTVNVGAGTYNETLSMVKNGVTLNGAQSGVAGNDAARGVGETIIAPNSPGILVTGNNVTVDGVSIDGADYGVQVSNADNVTLKNNIITDSSIHGVYAVDSDNLSVMNSVVDTTGSHGVYLLRSHHADVTGNDIGLNGGAGNIKGDGVRSRDSNYMTVSGNTIANTGPVVNDHGSGVYVLFGNYATVSGNEIYDTAWDGVKVQRGDGHVVSGNDIHDVTRTGVALDNTTNTTISGNEMENLGIWGIWSTRDSNLDILGNYITNVIGEEGIYAKLGSDILVSGNHVNGTGLDGIQIEDYAAGADGTARVVDNVVGGSGQDGISIVGTSGVSVRYNNIGKTYANVARDGVSITNADLTKVQNNDVAHTGRNGVFVNVSNNAQVNFNTINTTERHGVYVLDSNVVKVSKNTIGTTGGAGNIKGDGIRGRNTDGMIVTRNRIANTQPLVNDHGSGVYMLFSNNSLVNGNHISATSWDGVKVQQGVGHVVEGNTIVNVTRTGVAIDRTTDSVVRDNSIDGSGIWGVWSARNDNLDILNNDIFNITAEEGIYALLGSDLTIDGNDINNTGLDGIQVEKIGAGAGGTVNITNNYVGGTGQDGIAVKETENAYVAHNNIGSYFYGVGRDGVSIIDSPSADVYDNEIANTGRYGVFIDPSDYSSVTYNSIYNTGNDGVYVLDSDFVNVEYNTIGGGYYGGYYGADKMSALVYDGDYYGGYYGGYVNGHGVHFVNSNAGTIAHNDISNTERNGILVENAFPQGEDVSYDEMFTAFLALPGNGVNIYDNDIFDTDWDGIGLDNTQSALVENNRVGVIGYIGGDGIDATDSDNIRILSNFIGHDGLYDSINWDGIRLQNSEGSEISGNTIYNVGHNGISAYNIYGYLMISGNNIYNVQHDGIYVQGGMPIIMGKNARVYDGYYGYYGGYYGAPEVYIEDNIVQNSGGYYGGYYGYYGAKSSAMVYEGYYGYYGYNGFAAIEVDVGADGYAGISGNNVGSFFEYGLYASSGEIDLTGAANTIHDTNIGMGFYPYAPYVYNKIMLTEAPILGDLDYLGSLLRLTDNTIGFTQFIDQSSQFVDLGYGAFFMPGAPTLLDGLRATYTTAGVTIDPSANGGAVTQDEHDYLESMFTHYVDYQDRGLFFFPVLDTSSLDQKDVFRFFGRFVPVNNGGSLVITGLPRIGGGGQGGGAGGGAGGNNFVFAANNLNEIAPAAGGEEDQGNNDAQNPAGVEPAAGNGVGNAPCWSAANQTLGQGAPVQINYGNSTSQALEDAVSCGAQLGQQL